MKKSFDTSHYLVLRAGHTVFFYYVSPPICFHSHEHYLSRGEIAFTQSFQQYMDRTIILYCKHTTIFITWSFGPADMLFLFICFILTSITCPQRSGSRAYVQLSVVHGQDYTDAPILCPWARTFPAPYYHSSRNWGLCNPPLRKVLSRSLGSVLSHIARA